MIIVLDEVQIYQSFNIWTQIMLPWLYKILFLYLKWLFAKNERVYRLTVKNSDFNRYLSYFICLLKLLKSTHAEEPWVHTGCLNKLCSRGISKWGNNFGSIFTIKVSFKSSIFQLFHDVKFFFLGLIHFC